MQASILRNKDLSPIDTAALRKYCPAIFAKQPRADVSDRYGFIPTYEILEAMADAKFVPVEVRNFPRLNARDLRFTQHMIRFRQAGKVEARTVGDVVPQIVMLNSHDRTARFQLYGGLYRLVCANGLLVSTDEFVQPYIVKHLGDISKEVVKTSGRIIEQHGEVFKYVDMMRKVEMSKAAQLAFATAALTLRKDRPGIIDPADILVPRRPSDTAPNVWNVYNTVQENMTKGGVQGVTANGRRTVTHEVKGIKPDMRINAGVWSLAMQAIAKAQASSKAATKRK